jgi:hypothetical protein
MPLHSALTGAELHEPKGVATATDGYVARAASGVVSWGTVGNDNVIAGMPVQCVGSTISSVVSSSSDIPDDNSIPQNTEGAEVITLAITPKSTTNKLVIEVKLLVSHTGNATVTAALFQDTTAAALAAAGEYIRGDDSPQSGSSLCFTHVMAAGTTSATTFKVRVGGGIGSGIAYVNANPSGTRLYGGVASSSIVITEYKAS